MVICNLCITTSNVFGGVQSKVIEREEKYSIVGELDFSNFNNYDAKFGDAFKLDIESSVCTIEEVLPSESYPPFPKHVKKMSTIEIINWLQDTDEGKGHKKLVEEIRKKRMIRHFKVSKNNQIEIAGLDTGEYLLKIAVKRVKIKGMVPCVVLEFEKRIEVNNEANQRIIDLGVIKGRGVVKFDPIPIQGLGIKDLDGVLIDLSKYRGKFVILDFWATWCQPCIKETPNFIKLYDQFGGSKGKLEIVGVSYDEDEKQLKRYLEKNKIKWVNGMIGYRNEKAWDIRRKFLVSGFPRMYLFDPEGVFNMELTGGDNMVHNVKDTIKHYYKKNKKSGALSGE